MFLLWYNVTSWHSVVVCCCVWSNSLMEDKQKWIVKWCCSNFRNCISQLIRLNRVLDGMFNVLMVYLCLTFNISFSLLFRVELPATNLGKNNCYCCSHFVFEKLFFVLKETASAVCTMEWWLGNFLTLKTSYFVDTIAVSMVWSCCRQRLKRYCCSHHHTKVKYEIVALIVICMNWRSELAYVIH